MAEMKRQVLELLRESSGSPVSGKSVAERLGVTRAAVWKAVEELRADGYAVDAVTNRGYTLRADSDALTEDEIAKRLARPGKVVVFTETDSTNEQAKRMAIEGAPAGTVVAAARQTAAKGRLKRSFYAPQGTGAYFSLILRPELDTAHSLMATAAAAVAVVRAVRRLTGKEAQIKWVNDVYLNGKKICGILTEGQTDFESGGIAFVVVGIGVNISEPPGGFPAEAGGAGALNVRVPRAALIAEIVNELTAIDLAQPDFMEEYRAASMLLGKKITVFGYREQYKATAIEVLDGGELVVEDEAGERKVISTGEVSVRPAEA